MQWPLFSPARDHADNPTRRMNWSLTRTSVERECGQLCIFLCQHSMWWIWAVFCNLIYSRACSDNLAKEGSCKCAILNSSAVLSTLAFCSHLLIFKGSLWFQITWLECKVQSLDSCHIVNTKLAIALIEIIQSYLDLQQICTIIDLQTLRFSVWTIYL